MKNNFKKMLQEDENQFNIPEFDFASNTSPDMVSPISGKTFSFEKLYTTVTNRHKLLESDRKVSNPSIQLNPASETKHSKKNTPPDQL
jgi:hypothetical protein